MKSIKKARNLEGKRVIVRVDFNVQVRKGEVVDDFRLLAHVPTIQWLVEKGAKVLLLAHLGRPDGKVVGGLKMDPIAERFGKLLKKKVKKIETGNWKLGEKKLLDVEKQLKKMRNGSVVLFENVRFAKGETSNDPAFAELLASFGDVFVLDGFGVAHRDAASVTGIARILPSYAGPVLLEEMKVLGGYAKRARPRLAIFGGQKLKTKLPAIERLSKKSKNILIGGVLMNTYFKAKGYGIGDSKTEDADAKALLKLCKKRKVILPVDVVVGTFKGKNTRVVKVGKRAHMICEKGEGVFDVGPETVKLYAKHIRKAKTFLWNGAMGYMEQPPYHHATLAIGKLFAARSKGVAYGMIGGGETIRSMDDTGMIEFVDFVSTGGGAMLQFLSGRGLPGVEALDR